MRGATALGALGLIASIAVGVAAQGDAAPSASPSPSPPPTSAGVQKVEVRLAQYDVIVRDSARRFVRGLGKDAFRVTEDGIEMEIVAVDEWGGAPAPTSPAASPSPTATPASPPAPEAESETRSTEEERRSFVLVFDALGDSTALRMNQAKRAAQSFVRAHVGSKDLVAVYQLDLSLRPLCGFSSDRDDSARAIEAVSWRPGSMLQDEIAESVLGYSSTSGNARAQQRLTEMSMLAASQLDWQREHTYESLRGLSEVFQGLPGRRILVLVSPGFPMSTAGDLRAQTGGFTIKFQNLIRSLSRFGVTVYSLDIGNDLAIADAANAMDWRVAAGKFGMDENILSDLGLERVMGTGGAGKRREFLGFLAAETGGRLLTSTDFSRDFETIQEESTTFYRISCRVRVTRDSSRYRRTTIQATRPGLIVTSRRGRYSDITPLEIPAANNARNADSLDRYKAIAARGAATPLPSTDPRKIPVTIVVEAVGPIDITTDAAGAGSLDVEFHVLARAADEIVDRYDRAFTAKVKPGGAAALRGALRMEGRLALVPGIYEMQATVRLLDPPQLASWKATVAVPPPPSGETPAISNAFLMRDGGSESPLISRPEIVPASDPLTLREGLRVLPPTSTDFDTGSPLLSVFWVRGLPLQDGKPQGDLTIEVIDEHGSVIEVATQLLLFAAESTGGQQVLARLDTGSLGAGAYAVRLGVRATGDASPPARRTIPFSLRAPAGTAGPKDGATSSSGR